MKDEILKPDLVRVSLSDNKRADLPCLIDSKSNIVKIYDYQGNELKHNPQAKTVFWRNQYWNYC
ncbi:hypothetical protein FJU68_09680 [Acinetobacter baumannii]|nr:hypothetical protein FJU68_09680 [Acinetobacter baumannii]